MGLIFDSGMKAFPPRLPEQPIFYPVLNEDYARQIARDWNAPSAESGFAGFVTSFDMRIDYLKRFPVKTVGSSVHQELWVPAEELEDFNNHILGHIRAVGVYYGAGFTGFVPDKFGLARKNAIKQLECLALTIDYSGMDFICEMSANAKAVYVNFPFWAGNDFTASGIVEEKRQKVLRSIRKIWDEKVPAAPLCNKFS